VWPDDVQTPRFCFLFVFLEGCPGIGTFSKKSLLESAASTSFRWWFLCLHAVFVSVKWWLEVAMEIRHARNQRTSSELIPTKLYTWFGIFLSLKKESHCFGGVNFCSREMVVYVRAVSMKLNSSFFPSHRAHHQ
jgi:hypothetical protein